jgi:hypothetical protein
MHSSFPQRCAAADSCTKKQHALTHASISVAKLVPFTFLSAISNTFNPLFKVLFIFPSCYLFAIGLKLIFSFRWNLPPTLRSTSKERDSEITRRAHRAANAIKDSHPHWCSFSRGFHLRLMLATRLNATIQSRSFSFQAELFPVHSPLLREFCLVYFPPLTYMLKFSRFADLTSCCSSWEKICKQICKYWTICAESFSLHAPHITNSCIVAHKKQHTLHSFHKHWSRHTSRDYPEVQYAFKYPLIHGILQFTTIITLCCVLHRCLSRDIRRWKL